MKPVKIWIEIFTACQNMIQPFYHPSVFEWKTSRVQLQANFFETRQNLNRDFYSVSEYDTTILSPVSFWMENFSFQTLKQNSFHQENLLENEQSFKQNFRDKIRFWNKPPQRSGIRINIFETCQVLKLKSSEARKNWRKNISMKSMVEGNFAPQKSFFA